MRIYSLKAPELSEIKISPFKLEREIQTVFENNLKSIMGVTFIKSEFTIKNKRIDTLGFYEESNSFVIIEYKRDRNSSVFDQGITYLKLILENKADFVIEYNGTFNKKIKREDIDWAQSRVAFVSTSFNYNQIQSTDC